MHSIRSAEVEDAAAIAHVHVQSWRTTYTGLVTEEYLASLNEAERVPLWQEWLTRDISVFVAEVAGRIVGFAAGGHVRESLAGYDAELYTIYLLGEVQGGGIGRDLLRAVAGALIAQGRTSLLVWVLEQNPAVHFYEKMGAQHLMSKPIEISGVPLTELALGWPDLRRLTPDGRGLQSDSAEDGAAGRGPMVDKHNADLAGSVISQEPVKVMIAASEPGPATTEPLE